MARTRKSRRLKRRQEQIDLELKKKEARKRQRQKEQKQEQEIMETDPYEILPLDKILKVKQVVVKLQETQQSKNVLEQHHESEKIEECFEEEKKEDSSVEGQLKPKRRKVLHKLLIEEKQQEEQLEKERMENEQANLNQTEELMKIRHESLVEEKEQEEPMENEQPDANRAEEQQEEKEQLIDEQSVQDKSVQEISLQGQSVPDKPLSAQTPEEQLVQEQLVQEQLAQEQLVQKQSVQELLLREEEQALEQPVAGEVEKNDPAPAKEMLAEQYQHEEIPGEKQQNMQVSDEKQQTTEVSEEKQPPTEVPAEKQRTTDVPEEKQRTTEIPEKEKQQTTKVSEGRQQNKIVEEEQQSEKQPVEQQQNEDQVQEKQQQTEKSSVRLQSKSTRPKLYRPKTDTFISVPISLPENFELYIPKIVICDLFQSPFKTKERKELDLKLYIVNYLIADLTEVLDVKFSNIPPHLMKAKTSLDTSVFDDTGNSPQGHQAIDQINGDDDDDDDDEEDEVDEGDDSSESEFEEEEESDAEMNDLSQAVEEGQSGDEEGELVDTDSENENLFTDSVGGRLKRRSASVTKAVIKKASSNRATKESKSKIKERTARKAIRFKTAKRPQKKTASARQFNEAKFMKLFNQLVEYKKKYGDCNVPESFPENQQLSVWVRNMRVQGYYYRIGKHSQRMSAERYEMLEDLGFIWKVQLSLWDRNFDALCQFKEKHGNLNVPRNVPELMKLRNWMDSQRCAGNRYTRGESSPWMTKERVDKLNGLGFIWSSKENRWERNFGLLKEFKAKHGHTFVPNVYKENQSLSKWASHMRCACRTFLKEGRSSRITQERFDKLSAIGFMKDILQEGIV